MQIVLVLIAGAFWYAMVHRALFKRHYHAGINTEEWRAMFWPSLAAFTMLVFCFFIPFIFAIILLPPIIGLAMTVESVSQSSEKRGKEERKKVQED